jgi:hypothetical protein
MGALCCRGSSGAPIFSGGRLQQRSGTLTVSCTSMSLSESSFPAALLNPSLSGSLITGACVLTKQNRLLLQELYSNGVKSAVTQQKTQETHWYGQVLAALGL